MIKGTHFLKIGRHSKRRLICLFLTGFLLLLQPFTGNAEEYFNETYGIKFNYPDFLQPVNLKIPSLLIAMKAADNAFPSFNAIVLPLNYPVNEKERSRATEDILNEYKLVGLMDTSVASSSLKTINGADCLQVELNYSQNAVPMAAYVSVFYDLDRRFVLTFIDKSENYSQTKAIAKRITESFSILKSPKAGELPDSWPLPYHLIIVFSVLFLTVTVVAINRSRAG